MARRIVDPQSPRREASTMRLTRRRILGGLAASTLVGCGRFDAMSWVSRERFDVDRRFTESVTELPVPIPPALSDTETWSMLLFGDTHCWDRVPSTMGPLRDYLQRDPVDFVVHLGDLTDRGWPDEFVVMDQAFELLGVPSYATVGNHDMFNEGWAHFRLVFGPSVWELRLGPSLVIGLDMAGATLGGLQRSWLEERLSQTHGDVEHVFVASHYPLWVNGGESSHLIGSQQEAYDLLDLFRDFGVKAHFSGHSHLWGAATMADLRLITVSSMRESAPDRCAMRVDVRGTQVSYARIPFSGDGA